MTTTSHDVRIDSSEPGVVLDATWTAPAQAIGAVVFVHGSGSSRFSARNRAVAEVLQRAGFATLLLDLLTPDEERVDAVTRELRFDIPLLARRVIVTIDWLRRSFDETTIGLFGASTGAAAALIAAAARPDEVRAVVSRGGRPDLATAALARVRAPTLLIVGERDRDVLLLNRRALRSLAAPKALAVVPDATHLFEERGALEEVAALAVEWFRRHLSATRAAAAPTPS